MSLQIQIVGLFLSIAFFLLVFKQIKRRVLRPFYVALWVGFSAFLLSVFVASGELKWLSDRIFGFDDSRHFVYIISFGFLFIYAFYATIVLNRLQDEVRILISEVGILRSRHETLLDSLQGHDVLRDSRTGRLPSEATVAECPSSERACAK